MDQNNIDLSHWINEVHYRIDHDDPRSDIEYWINVIHDQMDHAVVQSKPVDQSRVYDQWINDVYAAINRFVKLEARTYDLDHADLEEIGSRTWIALSEGSRHVPLIALLFSWDVDDRIKYGYIRSIVRSRIEDHIRGQKRDRGNSGIPCKIPDVAPHASDCISWIKSPRSHGMIQIGISQAIKVSVPENKELLRDLQWASGNYLSIGNIVGIIMRDQSGYSMPYVFRFMFDQYIQSMGDDHLKALLSSVQAVYDGIATSTDYSRIDRARSRTFRMINDIQIA